MVSSLLSLGFLGRGQLDSCVSGVLDFSELGLGASRVFPGISWSFPGVEWQELSSEESRSSGVCSSDSTASGISQRRPTNLGGAMTPPPPVTSNRDGRGGLETEQLAEGSKKDSGSSDKDGTILFWELSSAISSTSTGSGVARRSSPTPALPLLLLFNLNMVPSPPPPPLVQAELSTTASGRRAFNLQQEREREELLEPIPPLPHAGRQPSGARDTTQNHKFWLGATIIRGCTPRRQVTVCLVLIWEF